MTSLVLLLTLSLLAAPAWAQDVPDIPDLGPPRPHFDPKKHCKCLDQYIKKIRGQIAAYRELAAAYEADARAVGAKGQPARWVDPRKLSPDERRVLRSLNSEFDEKERANNERASSTDECGFPDGDIILKTSALTGQPPTKDDQQREKPKFPFEELYDAV